MKNLKELLKIDLKANMFQGDQLFLIVTSSEMTLLSRDILKIFLKKSYSRLHQVSMV